MIEVAPGEVDLERFEAMAERGRDAPASGRPERAASVLRDALELWRDNPRLDCQRKRLRIL